MQTYWIYYNGQPVTAVRLPLGSPAWSNSHPKLQERVLTLVYMAGSRDADAYTEAYAACEGK